jgi:AraC-like DNA-binding protein
VIPPDRLHETDAPADLIASLWLDPGALEARRLVPPRTEHPILPIDRSKLDAVVPCLLEGWWKRYDGQRAAALLDHVVGTLAPRHEPDPPPALDSRVAHARDLLESVPHRRRSLAEIAARVALSPSRLTHLFTREIGIPMRRYLLWLRLREAIDELVGGASLVEAAFAAGFADSPHLSRTFRGMIGLPPSALGQLSRFVQDTAAPPG